MTYEDSTIAEAMFVDTIGLCIPDIDPSHLPKKFTQIGGTDETTWAKGNLESDSGKPSLQIRGTKSKNELNIAGSPAFHRQGHNIVGSNDVLMLAFTSVEDVYQAFKPDITVRRALRFARGEDIDVTRIDTPLMLQVPPGLSKSSVINGLALAGILAGNNTSLYINETCYFDQHSQLASAKFYDKEAEFSRKRRATLPASENAWKLRELMETTIRFEAVYRKKHLANYFSNTKPITPTMLTPEVLVAMLQELLGKYDLRRSLRRYLNDDDLYLIPRRYRSTVFYWQHGSDVLKMLDGDKAEYSRHRRFLMSEFSIDIGSPSPLEIESRIELGEILSPENFVPIPSEIRADPMLFFTRDMDEERYILQQRVAGR